MDLHFYGKRFLLVWDAWNKCAVRSKFSLLTLDESPTKVQLVPNHYVFEMSEPLVPTEYQTVLSNEWGDRLKKWWIWGRGDSFRYKLQNLATDGKASKPIQISATAIYTALVYSSKEKPVSVHWFFLWDKYFFVIMLQSTLKNSSRKRENRGFCCCFRCWSSISDDNLVNGYVGNENICPPIDVFSFFKQFIFHQRVTLTWGCLTRVI